MNNINYRLLKSANNLSVNLANTIKDKVNRLYSLYENYFGIKELKEIQLSVLNAEKVFTDASKARREAQAGILQLQEDLKRLRQKLDSTNRADEQYLVLLTDEHKLIKSEFSLMDTLRRSEEEEREKFTFFSNRLRESQDFEKARQEKLKYISLIGSVIGALLGIIATTINYSIKQKDLNNLTKSLERQVDQNKEINFYTIELKKIVDELEAKLEQKNLKSPTQANHQKVLNELKSINNRLVNINGSTSESLISENAKYNILLGGLTILSITLLMDILIRTN